MALGKLKEEYRAGGGGMLLLLKITKLAVNWLNQHIKGADRQFGEYFKASGLAGPGAHVS